jgi:hypothetical protein
MAISKEVTYWGLAFILFILVLMLFSTPDYQPYYKNIPYAKYEGFNVFGEAGNTKSGSSTIGGNTFSHSSTSDSEGFEALSPVNVDDSDNLDQFLNVKTVGVDGKNGCQSSGLSNSLGALCLTPDLIQQLKTRGGNATGL